jgi:hypothetical protein
MFKALIRRNEKERIYPNLGGCHTGRETSRIDAA